MGKTISFVASDGLAEWIEEESERRMTSISSTAQQLLAEKYRDEHGAAPSSSRSSEPSTPEEEGDEGGESVLDRHSEHWYRPDSDEGYKFAVRVPGRDSNKYYKTQEGAEERLRKEYGQ